MRLGLFVFILALVGLAWVKLSNRNVQADQAQELELAALANLQINGLPSIESIALDNEVLDSKRVSSPLFILHFWATWCGPCVSELPSLAKLAKENADISVWAVSGDSSKDAISLFVSKFPELKSDNFKILLDMNSEISSRFFVSKLPETFVFDRNKKLVKRIIGATDWMSSDAMSFVEQNLKETK